MEVDTFISPEQWNLKVPASSRSFKSKSRAVPAAEAFIELRIGDRQRGSAMEGVGEN